MSKLTNLTTAIALFAAGLCAPPVANAAPMLKAQPVTLTYSCCPNAPKTWTKFSKRDYVILACSTDSPAPPKNLKGPFLEIVQNC